MTELISNQSQAVSVEDWKRRRAETLAAENALFEAEDRALAEVASITDHTVAVAGGEITIRVYAPFADGVRPAVVHFHGGGFTLFSIDWLATVDWCRDICARTGSVVIDVDYRLAPEHPFPTAPEDCHRALEWVVEHSADI